MSEQKQAVKLTAELLDDIRCQLKECKPPGTRRWMAQTEVLLAELDRLRVELAKAERERDDMARSAEVWKSKFEREVSP